MRNAVHRLLIVCCALYLSGAHWMVLQTTAWTGMVLSRTLASGVVAAVETTFDGQHPCRMCTALAEGQKDENKSQKEFALLKKVGDLKFTAFSFLTFGPTLEPKLMEWPPAGLSETLREDAPPTPPPLA